jgi:hypothetical protein
MKLLLCTGGIVAHMTEGSQDDAPAGFSKKALTCFVRIH